MRWIVAALALAGCLESPPTGPGGDVSCGTLRALRDGFDSALDASQWITSSVDVSAGAARLTSQPAMPDAILDSVASYRIPGGQLTIDLDAADLGTGTLELSLIDTAGSALLVRVDGGELTVSDVPEGGGGAILVDQLFDPEQRLWRVREEDGAFFWATAISDGEPFTEDGPLALELGDLARFEVVLKANDTDTAVAIESINLDEAEPLCAAASLVDDFAQLDPRWQLDEQGDCDITVAGDAQLGYSAQALCALTTVDRFDLRDSAYSVELLEVADCAPEPVMLVRLADDRAFELLCDDDAGARKLVARSDGGDIARIDFDDDKHRVIRVRHDGRDKVLAFEASPDGVTWSQVGVARMDDPGPLASTSLRFYLGGETSGGFESVAFDSLGLPP